TSCPATTIAPSAPKVHAAHIAARSRRARHWRTTITPRAAKATRFSDATTWTRLWIVGRLSLQEKGYARNRLCLPVPEDAELVLGVADALLELPTVGRGLAAVDSFQLGMRVLELLPGPILVDLARGDGVVDKRDRAV